MTLEELGGDPVELEEVGGDAVTLEELGGDPVTLKEVGGDPVTLEELGGDPVTLEELGGDSVLHRLPRQQVMHVRIITPPIIVTVVHVGVVGQGLFAHPFSLEVELKPKIHRCMHVK